MARESKKKVIDRLYLTYSSEFAGKKFAYDGERSLYTVGPLPQNNFEFTVVAMGMFPTRYLEVLTVGLAIMVGIVVVAVNW